SGGATGEMILMYPWLLAQGDYRNNLALFAKLNKQLPIAFEKSILANLIGKNADEIPNINYDGELIEILLNASITDLNNIIPALDYLFNYINVEEDLKNLIFEFADEYRLLYQQF